MNNDSMKGKNLQDMKVNVKIKLAALWASLMFIYIYVDLYSLYKPGVIEDILKGIVWQFEITQGWAMGALVLMAIPSLMIFLSIILKPKLNRWINIIVGILYIIISVGNVIGETWFYYIFGTVIEFVLLILVVWFSWKWPTTEV